MDDQVHSDDNVEHKVAVEEPVAGIVGAEAEHNISIVGYGNGIL